MFDGTHEVVAVLHRWLEALLVLVHQICRSTLMLADNTRFVCLRSDPTLVILDSAIEVLYGT